MARQFESEDNAAIHASTTAAEVLLDFNGQPLDWVCLGYGTGGTYSGMTRTFTAARPNVKFALVEPTSATLVASQTTQSRHSDGSPSADHVAFKGPHPIQGWTPSFLPLVTEKGIKARPPNALLAVDGDESSKMALELARAEGIFTGVSGGGSVAGAIKLAASDHVKPGSHILCVLADTQERYLSAALGNAIPAIMSEEELAIMKSTPRFQVDKNQ